MRWDAKTAGPITHSAERRLALDEMRSRNILIILSHYDRVQHPVSPNDLRDGANLIERPSGARNPRPQTDDPPPFRALGETYCGFDMYDISPRAQDNSREHGGHERLEAPFDRAELFARRNRDGQYDTVIACEATPSAGWCRAATDFRGWPMMLLFSGKHLCAFDRIREQSRALLGAHLVASSPRTEQPPAGARLIPAIDDVPRH